MVQENFCVTIIRYVKKTFGILILYPILASWKVIGYSKKEQTEDKTNKLIMLANIYIKGNKFTGFINNEGSFNEHIMWCTISEEKVQTRLTKTPEFLILSALIFTKCSISCLMKTVF